MFLETCRAVLEYTVSWMFYKWDVNQMLSIQDPFSVRIDFFTSELANKSTHTGFYGRPWPVKFLSGARSSKVTTNGQPEARP